MGIVIAHHDYIYGYNPVYNTHKMWVRILHGKIRYHQLGSLNNKYLGLTVLGSGNFKIKVPADPMSRESPSWLVGLPSHFVLVW